MNWTIEIEHRDEDEVVYMVDEEGKRERVGFMETKPSGMIRVEYNDGVYMFDSRRRAIGFLMMMN
jgi:hypothetical protein